MKKLTTALLIILPLILLMTLFSIAKVAKITADIPVGGVVIQNRGDDGVFFIDMSDYPSPITARDLNVVVLPQAAANHEFTMHFESLDGKRSNLIEINESGEFLPRGLGVARLVCASKDGGYTDSVLFDVVCDDALNFVPFIRDKNGNERALSEGAQTDFSVNLESGIFTIDLNLFPASARGKGYRISSSDESVILPLGGCEILAKSAGECTLTITAQTNGEPVSKTISVAVEPSSSLTINGRSALKGDLHLSAPLGVDALSFTVCSAAPIDETCLYGDDISSVSVLAKSNVYNVQIALSNAYFATTVKQYSLLVGDEAYTFYVDFEPLEIAIISPFSYEDNKVAICSGDSLLIYAKPNIEGYSVRYNWQVEDAQLYQISSENSACVLKALGEGESTLTLTWELLLDSEVISSGMAQRQIMSVNGCLSLLFADCADAHGDGDLAIAKYSYSEENSKQQNIYKAKLKTYGMSGKSVKLDDIILTTTEGACDISLGSENVEIRPAKDGKETAIASWKYASVFGTESAEFSFLAVDGIKVGSDAQLKAAFAERSAAVLDCDIYLGEDLFEKNGGSRTPKYDSATMRQKLSEYTFEIDTTSDWKYHQNVGQARPKLRCCLDITAGLYGNGHIVSADNITYMLDATDTLYDFAIFDGPADFVATSLNGAKLAAVKGQDNIAFLVRTDGVIIDNVILKGCNDESIYDDGAINLLLLNCVGTTLELMANATVKNSRIMNGRTCVRIFGRENIDENSPVNAASEKIYAALDNCTIQNSREFLLKMGTNRYLRADIGGVVPSLYDKQGNEYAHNSTASDKNIDDDYFVSELALTDVTLKDCLFRTSGLFSIGIESHFSGNMLADKAHASIVLSGWANLMATSYPAILHLVGDTVLADWKPLSDIDSSTLIECGTAQGSFAFLSFDISKMLDSVRDQEEYKNVIKKQNGKDYAHGGIAFYGGGKNYSALDLGGYTFEAMHSYNVNLSVLASSSDNVVASQGTLIPLAAGEEDFRFIMFDATSNFSPKKQSDIYG